MTTVKDKALKVLTSGLFWSLLFFSVVVVSIVLAVDSVSESVTVQQLELIETAAVRSAVQCYTLEGVYPVDLQYLIDNYGFYYDSENFVVHYNNLGGNLLPDIAVFYIGGDSEDVPEVESTPPVGAPSMFPGL